jgi:ferritin-like metal-binding protein YciE
MTFCRFSTIAYGGKNYFELFFQFAKEAYACEAKEDKLVTNAVKHLTEANVQINQLSEEFNVKSDESHRQKEEITHLLAQVSIILNTILTKKSLTTMSFWREIVYLVTRDKV